VVDATYDEKTKQTKTRERLQAFEGVCISRAGEGLNESFTVRKLSYGEGVERVFPIYSPVVDSVQVVRKGKVRRAKLYYLRGRRGKSARISERVERGGKRSRRKARARSGFARIGSQRLDVPHPSTKLRVRIFFYPHGEPVEP